MAPWLFLAHATPDFYHVNGTEYILPGTFINGNPPLPSGPMIVCAALIGLALLAIVAALQYRLPWSSMGRTRRVLVLVLMVGNFFAFWEMGMQVCARMYRQPAFVPDPVMFWRLNPKLDHQWIHEDPGNVAWWKRGVRPLPDSASLGTKPANAYRMIFFGESQLVSIDHKEIDIPDSYPHVLQRLLERALPDHTFDIINAGVPGYSSWQGLLLCRRLLSQKPDMVVFAFGYHDCRPSYATDRSVLTTNPFVYRMRVLLYRSELFLLMRKLVIEARESAEEKMMQDAQDHLPTFRVPPNEFAQNLRALVELGRKHGFRVAFLLQPLAHHNRRIARVLRYQAIMRKIAAQDGVLLLDVFDPMQKLTPPDDSRYWDDEIHMSSQGHRAVASILLHELLTSGLAPFKKAKASQSSGAQRPTAMEPSSPTP